MKIAILTSTYLPTVGGTEVFAHNLARQLRLFGNTVHVFVSSWSYGALQPQHRGGLRPLPRKFYGVVHSLPWVGWPWARLYLGYMQRTQRYDVWLAVGAYPSGHIATCLLGAVPVVLVGVGADIQTSPELGYGLRLDPVKRARIDRAVRAYSVIVAPGETVRQDLLGLGVPANSIVTIPHGVDLDWFEREQDVAALRADLGWPQDRVVILTTGRNHPKKGYRLIPAIAAELKDRGFQFRWYVVGRDTSSLDGELRSRGLDDYVATREQVGVGGAPQADWRFPDKRLVRMYQASDIYAFPSLLETFGIVQLEAMAAGCAVVSTDAPGCRDVVVHEHNGLQAPAGDAAAFAEQLARLLANQELRARLAARGRQSAQSYSWRGVAERYQALFRSLAEAPRATREAAANFQSRRKSLL